MASLSYVWVSGGSTFGGAIPTDTIGEQIMLIGCLHDAAHFEW